MRAETGRWLRQAREDLATTRVTLAGERWAAATFFAQQVAEKALKALLVEREGRQPPRTHDLVALARCAQLPEAFAHGLAVLTRAHMMSRYPDVLVEPEAGSGIDRADAERHARHAEEVMTWVEEHLSTAS
jgi:HEPN domain-containing protein